jgi:aspartyl-tRNA(Asn)/glutamyl-tRNA(Gln) amidotransferase subunit A
VPSNYFFDGVDGTVAEATYEAIRTLESLGAGVADVSIPTPEEANEACRVLIWSEAAAYHRERMDRHPEAYSPDTLEFIRQGAAFSGMDYARARQAARTWHRTIRHVMDATDIDVIVTPLTSTPAPLIAESAAVETTFRLVHQVYPFSLIRLPGLALPCGFAGGLPIGMHIVARDFCDALLLRIGYAYQRVTDWHRRRPPLAVPSDDPGAGARP